MCSISPRPAGDLAAGLGSKIKDLNSRMLEFKI
jgi:hypothetical protein